MPRRSTKKTQRKRSAGAQRTGSSASRSGSAPRGGAKRTKKKATKKRQSGPWPAPSAEGEKPKRKPAKKSAKKRTPSRSAETGAAGAPPQRDKPQRLQKLLAAAGFGSRRQCESMIEEGRVDVDGQIVSELGTVVDPSSQAVRVDGVPLRQQKLVYYAVNKPTGFLSTNADPRGRQRVIDLVPNSERVFPVGRLDQSSQGLMLLTNDGDLAQQLTHPKYGVRKVYRVTVAGKIDGETMRNMRKGMYISDGFVRVEGAKIVKSRSRATEMEITLREGKNREIRRILARLGHKVQVLRRIAIGPLRLGDVPIGAHRSLSREEVKRLRLAVEHSRNEVDGSDDRPRRSGQKKTSRKKSGGKSRRAETRSDVTARRTRRKTPTTKFSFKPKGNGGGKVIGGD